MTMYLVEIIRRKRDEDGADAVDERMIIDATSQTEAATTALPNGGRVAVWPLRGAFPQFYEVTKELHIKVEKADT